MEYSWHMEETGSQDSNTRNNRSGRQQGPGLIDELEAFMAPVGEGCGFAPLPDTRRIGGHQLPESPPDSGSENPYSPETHAITVHHPVLGPDYLLVHDQVSVPHDMMHPTSEYIYEELKNDEVLRGSLSDVVVLPQDPNLVDLGLRNVRHDIGLSDVSYQNRYNQIRMEMPDLEQGIMNPQLVAVGHETLTPVYTNLQEPSVKKRKHSQDVNSQVKCEPVPVVLSPETLSPQQARVAPPSVDGSEAGDDAPFQCIRFAPFQQNLWHSLYDQNLKPLQAPSYVVGADKGFNYSQIDEAFVCQKKNHFQVTCQMQMSGEAHYVKTGDGFKKITNFYLHFYGVKAEDPSQEVRVEQSQSDRTKKPFHPVPVEVRREGTKVTVGRLHFAETTNNNMRKKGRPNPDQRHFQLVLALKAHCMNVEYMIAASASDRIIVRASNPGQFESDCSENWWQRGVSENSVHYSGRVGINTDRPDEACVINGNLKVMGHIVHPSDERAKHNIQELDTAQQLKNVQSIRVVNFNYDPSFAEHSGLLGLDPRARSPARDTGVIAQEVRRVLPEAVREAGDVTLPNGDTIHKFLVVNKDRIFMENLGAVKELCKVTGHLESRIDQLERINKRLCKITTLQRRDSARSSVSNDSRFSGASNTSKSLYSDGNISIDQIRDIARNIRRHECCHKLSHNSPKYTRKQCKSCHQHSTYTKFGKYYNTNKTTGSSGSKDGKSQQHICPDYNNVQYIDSLESKTVKSCDVTEDNQYSSLRKKKESCFWMRNSDSDRICGSSNLAFCCRKKSGGYADTELISNKFLQIVITILIFIMAVCLVVMSALYFREHQELLTMRETRLQDKYSQYARHGKVTARLTTSAENVHQNQILNSKHSQHSTAKKTPKEKGTHKTTPEYITTPSIAPETHSVPTLSTIPVTPLHASKNYVKHVLQMGPSPGVGGVGGVGSVGSVGSVSGRVSVSRGATPAGCAPDNALSSDLDADCLSACSLDPPQAYDNQEPLERSNPDKDLNETTNFARPLEPSPIDKHQIIIQQPVIPEKNNTESDNDSLKNQLHDDIAESNLLDNNSNKIVNGTENETSSRLKRDARLDAILFAERERGKRETNEEYLRMNSDADEMALSDQSDEIVVQSGDGCDSVTFGIKSKTFANDTMFTESVCPSVSYNITYIVPISKCLKEKHIDMNFKSSKLKQLRLCDLQCKYDTAKNCLLNREWAKPVLSDDAWTFKMTLECTMERELKLRASFAHQHDLCFLTPDDKVPFVEYNIRFFRDCHN